MRRWAWVNDVASARLVGNPGQRRATEHAVLAQTAGRVASAEPNKEVLK